MIDWLWIILLFLIGVRLSFFFSGIETAFYRASRLRLNIDAQTGDVPSKRILRFVADPSQFVATILIGNNLANYVTTCAIGYGAIQAFGNLSEAVEVGVTVLISPVIFIFGELLPKTLHYRAPLLMLKRNFLFFQLVHILLLPFSWPLMLLTRVFQSVGGVRQQPMLRILGRRPLANVIGHGRDEGIVTEVQHNLMQGVFVNANKPLESLVIPAEIAFSFEDELSHAALLKHARDYGLADIAIATTTEDSTEVDYFRVSDLLLTRGPLQDIRRPMPTLQLKTSRLEALLILQEHDADLGAVFDGDDLIGIVRRSALAETLYQGSLSLSAAAL